MDSIVTQTLPEADERFDTARITAAVDALAAKHAGREDLFRAATAQLLKAEMAEARAVAQAVLLKDRHGRRCAERLCHVQDEIIRILFSAATRHLYRSPVPSGAVGCTSQARSPAAETIDRMPMPETGLFEAPIRPAM